MELVRYWFVSSLARPVTFVSFIKLIAQCFIPAHANNFDRVGSTRRKYAVDRAVNGPVTPHPTPYHPSTPPPTTTHYNLGANVGLSAFYLLDTSFE
jgi:hypothetical protein